MFIPVEKMKKLRESAKNGDERARKILIMQMDGKEDFSSLMDEYFAEQEPVVENGLGEKVVEEKATETKEPEKVSKLQEFLSFNGITKDSPDYKSYVEDFYKENPNEPREVENPVEQIEDNKDGFESVIKDLIKDETDAIDEYSKAITKFMGSEELDEVFKRRVIARLKEIRGDEEEHFRELNELLKAKGDKPEEKID